MSAFSAKEDLDQEEISGWATRVVRVMIGSTLGCFGFVTLVFGVGVIGMMLWMAIVRKDYEGVTNIGGMLAMAAIAILGWLIIRYAAGKMNWTDSDGLRELENPDWLFYAEHLQRPVPIAMQHLYEERHFDREFAEISDETGHELESFDPIQPDYLIPEEDSELLYPIVPFATLDEQTWVFLKPGPCEHDRVLIADPLVPENVEVLFESIDEFVEALNWKPKHE